MALREGNLRTSVYAIIALASFAAVLLAAAPRSSAQSADECLVGVNDQASGYVADGATLCAEAQNKKCTFNLALCLNLSQSGCDAGEIKSEKGTACGKKLKKASRSGTGSACGGFVGVKVKTKKHGTAERTCVVKVMAKTKGKPSRKDSDTVTLMCKPQAGQCSTTTTTTTSPSTTTTTIPMCGNGVREGDEECDDGNTDNTDGCTNACKLAACGDGFVHAGVEQCDPPCGTGCGAGQICNESCQCETASACACGTPDPTQLKFTTSAPSSLQTGSLMPSKCVQCVLPSNCGNDCTTDAECIDGGTCRGPLTSGGLYFGGGLVGVALPNQVPDLGTSFTKTCCNGTKLVLAATTDTDTGVDARTCTSAGCLFGPPLPIPNQNNAAVSTCVINSIARNAVGTATCTTGDTPQLSLPLTSVIYLTGDIDNEPANGIQPCPICRPDTNVCMGGPNDGMPCTPGDSGPDFPNGPYPTSHDCPPPEPQIIGQLPIGFNLSSGTQTVNSFSTSAQQRAFCAYCFDDVATSQFERPPHACTSDSDCTTGNFTSCRQQSAHNGAFGNTGATTITETGTPAGSLVDHLPHASTLVSVFCIPPTYNPIIDPTADLPGPGAVSLPGSAQLIPQPLAARGQGVEP